MILRLARSEPVKPAGRTYDEQYAWLLERTDPASSFERAFLDHLYERKLRLPDFAQYTPVPDVFVQPDFYYQRGRFPASASSSMALTMTPPLAEKRISKGEKRLKIEDIE